MEDRQFPVHSSHKKYLKSIPWAMIKPHEEQAMKNHYGQDLETLAKRGGCDLYEIFFILEDKSYDSHLTKIHEIEDFKYAIEEKIKEFKRMDGGDFRKAVIDASKYLAFFEKEVCIFHEPIEVEWGMNGKKKKVIPTICFMEAYNEE